ncbi:UNVERIFIED_CONTAM: hypothetical protein Scaly_0016400 [Sesamum calycinum]|uniref:Uncharacterized protein n=1 Tax=Sesamum calycinum TaxID=2727403 RepID=A0AAW2STA9_9LAMI
MMLFLKGRMRVNDPSLSVFKGYGLSKAAEEYLSSHGLKNAIYSIDASDVQDDLFGQLIMCPFRGIEGITDLKVRVLEGIASVEVVSEVNTSRLQLNSPSPVIIWILIA